MQRRTFLGAERHPFSFRQQLCGRGEDDLLFDRDVRLVQLLQLGGQGEKAGRFGSRQRSRGEPRAAEPVHFRMQRFHGQVFAFQVRHAFEHRGEVRTSEGAQAREQRFFLIGGVFRRRLPEVTERGFEGRALVRIEFAALGGFAHAHEHGKESLDAPVAAGEHSDGILETAFRLRANGHGHVGLPSLSIVVHCRGRGL